MEWKENGEPFKAGDIRVDEDRQKEDGVLGEEGYAGWKNGAASAGIKKIFQKPELPYVKIGLVLVAGILLTVFLVSGSGSDVDRDRLLQLENRIQVLEQQLADVSRTAGEKSLPADQVTALGTRLDQLETTAHARMAQISGQVSAIDKQLAGLKKSLTAKSQSTAAPVKKTPAAARLHKVAAGETLYAIARRYGKTVKQLRQMNGLSSSGKIYPGQ